MMQSVTLRDKKELSDLFEETGIAVDVTDDLFLEFSKKLEVNMESNADMAMVIAKTLVDFSHEFKVNKE